MLLVKDINQALNSFFYYSHVIIYEMMSFCISVEKAIFYNDLGRVVVKNNSNTFLQLTLTSRIQFLWLSNYEGAFHKKIIKN